MKGFLAIVLIMLVGFANAASREYTLRVPDSGLPGVSWQFDNSAFVDDTISYGDTVTFHVYVDCNAQVPVAPMLFMLLAEAGTSDSLKVSSTITYSQFANLNYELLGDMQSYYTKDFKSTTAVYDLNDADYYPVSVADSIVTSGLAYPGFSLIRSVYYKVLVIPLKADVAVYLADFRYRQFLQPAQFK